MHIENLRKMSIDSKKSTAPFGTENKSEETYFQVLDFSLQVSEIIFLHIAHPCFGGLIIVGLVFVIGRPEAEVDLFLTES